jgi:hypothetical protein
VVECNLDKIEVTGSNPVSPTTLKRITMDNKKDWGILLGEAIAALRIAHEAMHDIGDWSGSSGNWPLHESLPTVDAALALLDPLASPTNKLEEK